MIRLDECWRDLRVALKTVRDGMVAYSQKSKDDDPNKIADSKIINGADFRNMISLDRIINGLKS